MKKYTLILAVLLLTMPLTANPVDIKTAQRVAETFMQAQTGTKAVLHQIEYTDQAEFPHFYVFGTENSFVIISADDCVQPVLGYSTENPFGTEKMPENLFWWLKGYDEQIADASQSGQKATSEVAQQWIELISGNTSKAKSEVIVGPLIQTQWGQGSPYNNLCPTETVTGCVATAMAQILKYWTTVYENEMYANPQGFWNYLTKGFGSHSYTHPEYGVQSANFGNTTYNWMDMTNTYSGSSTDAEKAAVATLLYHCGISVNMNYGTNESGALTLAVAEALKAYFNYNQTTRYITRASIVNEDGQEDLEQWKNILKNELSANRPIQYCGSGSGGHSFICDGYNSNDEFHFNWGWDGNKNGYFPITNLTPPGHNYNQDQAAIIGIQPISYHVQPSQLNFSVSNRNVSLTWNEVQDVSSYNVYRDYSLIGNTSTNSYLDSEVPVGNHVYYFRCVDSEGNVSLPSNTQSVDVDFGYTLENLMVKNLEISYNNGNATLQWEAPINLNHIDFYSFEGSSTYLNIGNHNTFYWGARFPSSMLTNGTSITSVSTFFYTSGTYTAYVYKCTSAYPTSDPITVNGTYSKGWHNIPIGPITIDNEQDDIWVIFKSTGIVRPTILGVQNTEHGNYYSTDGTDWTHFTGYSFFVSASLSDNNFTYTLYDNGEIVVTNSNVPIYTDSNISSNTAHQYTVKTKLGQEETDASNMVGIAIGTASINGNLTLGDNDEMIVLENSSLKVSGNLTNANSANLIIEEGGQLITGSENVQATVKKHIEQASNWGEGEYTPDGWYFIASPIVSTEDYVISGMTTSDETIDENTVHTFDLYRYNGSTSLEWENYWSHHTEETPFTIDNGTGYLYASKNGTTIRFKGVINPYSTTSNTVTLTHDGWNLIGNPFTCQVAVDCDFAELNDGSSVTYKDAGSTINPCAGIAVYGNTDEEVTFTAVEPQENTSNPNNLNITLTQQVVTRDASNNATIDNAVVSFNENAGLPKFPLLEANSKLYIPKDKEEYAIVSSAAQGEMPINFRVAEDGIYTLTVNPEGVEMNYLHLIDNLTGNDIDLLTSPDYTFEAKMTDYASRFKLVFNAKTADGPSTPSTGSGTEGSGTFAYYADGEIRVIEACHGASLQVVDMTGRVIRCTDGACTVSTDGMTPGVYVLRLIDGENVKTQKIVIE